MNTIRWKVGESRLRKRETTADEGDESGGIKLRRGAVRKGNGRKRRKGTGSGRLSDEVGSTGYMQAYTCLAGCVRVRAWLPGKLNLLFCWGWLW